MSWLAAISGIVGSGLGLIGSSMQSDAIKSAADEESKALTDAINELNTQYQTALKTSGAQNYENVGVEALNKLSIAEGLNPYTKPGDHPGAPPVAPDPLDSKYIVQRGSQQSFNQESYDKDMQKYVEAGTAYNQSIDAYNAAEKQYNSASVDPTWNSLNKPFSFNANDAGYQEQLKEGLSAVKASDIAKGTFYGGAGIQDVVNSATGLTATNEQQQYNQDLQTKVNYYNNLMNLVGTGKEVTLAQLSGDSHLADVVAGLQVQQGQTAANATTGTAAAWLQGIQGVNNNLNSAASQALLWNMAGGGSGGSTYNWATNNAAINNL